MSSIKIKDLPEMTNTLDDNDLMVIEDKEDTKKITLIRLRAAFSMDGILTSMKEMLLEKINEFIASHNSKYQELLERNTNLEVQCLNLENAHIHDAERIFELENRLVLQTNLVSDLLKEKDRLLKLILELQNQKDILLEKLNTLSKQAEENKKSIIILKSQVADLQIKVKELKDINEDLQNQIDQLEKESNDKIDSNFEDINNKLSESIEDLMAYIRYYHPDVDDLV